MAIEKKSLIGKSSNSKGISAKVPTTKVAASAGVSTASRIGLAKSLKSAKVLTAKNIA